LFPCYIDSLLKCRSSPGAVDMRLLQLDEHSNFSLTKDLINDIPLYAILSHTWGEEQEEITFNDLIKDSGKSKPNTIGYMKIKFCGEQAARDGLRYFWVDTCCIDKSNYTEFAEAINSMFQWYLNAAKCYVYLSDVSTGKHSLSSQPLWESTFRRSRWFTRGWTLQELIAPSSVEFFSRDGKRLGDKKSLEVEIHEITGIPMKAFQGKRELSDFPVADRIAWAERRETTRKEDLAYSILGIFNVSMPLIYGEGRERALKRLLEEVEKDSKGKSPP
jgi:Heterokaryon incompatibility protein (HET)